MLAAILNVEHLVRDAGYPLLFLIVMCESSGLPVPGETGLITAAVLASQGNLKIVPVIALAAATAWRSSPPASHSSNATAPRPSSSGASCWDCAYGPPGSPARQG